VVDHIEAVDHMLVVRMGVAVVDHTFVVGRTFHKVAAVVGRTFVVAVVVQTFVAADRMVKSVVQKRLAVQNWGLVTIVVVAQKVAGHRVVVVVDRMVKFAVQKRLVAQSCLVARMVECSDQTGYC